MPLLSSCYSPGLTVLSLTFGYCKPYLPSIKFRKLICNPCTMPGYLHMKEVEDSPSKAIFQGNFSD